MEIKDMIFKDLEGDARAGLSVTLWQNVNISSG